MNRVIKMRKGPVIYHLSVIRRSSGLIAIRQPVHFPTRQVRLWKRVKTIEKRQGAPEHASRRGFLPAFTHELV